MAQITAGIAGANGPQCRGVGVLAADLPRLSLEAHIPAFLEIARREAVVQIAGGEHRARTCRHIDEAHRGCERSERDEWTPPRCLREFSRTPCFRFWKLNWQLRTPRRIPTAPRTHTPLQHFALLRARRREAPRRLARATTSRRLVGRAGEAGGPYELLLREDAVQDRAQRRQHRDDACERSGRPGRRVVELRHRRHGRHEIARRAVALRRLLLQQRTL